MSEKIKITEEIIKKVEEIEIDNFYKIDQVSLEERKPKNLRLSRGYVDFSYCKDEKEYINKAVRFITRTSYEMFAFLTKENVNTTSLKLETLNSFCGLDKNIIQVGCLPLLIDGLDRHFKVDCIIGTLYHEFYHKTWTIPFIAKKLGFKGPISEFYQNKSTDEEREKKLKTIIFDSTFGNIHNIFEDLRIERNGAENFPGNIPYFERHRKLGLMLNYKKDLSNTDLVEYILSFIMTKVLLPELVDRFLLILEKQKELVEEALKTSVDLKDASPEFFTAYQERYKTVKDLIKKIGDLIDSNKTLIENFTDEECYNFSKQVYDLIPKEFVDELNERSKIKYISILSNNFQDNFYENVEKIPSELVAEMEKAIAQEIEEIEKQEKERLEREAIKIKNEKIISKDKNTPFTEFNIIEDNTPSNDTSLFNEARVISRSICEKLAFLDSKYSRNEEAFELQEGEIDETELWSVAAGNKLIFEEIDPIPSYNLDFGILLDESGSMSGPNIRKAKLATLAMILGLKDTKHVNLFVYGHSANCSAYSSSGVQLFSYYNTIEKRTNWRSIFNAKARSNNADGYAIEKMAEIMLKNSASKEKVLVVVSDGQPSANGYGGSSAISHVRKVVDDLERKGIYVVQICIDNISESPKMFKHYVPYVPGKNFFNDLKNILDTKLNRIFDAV